jgi:type II secretory pathway pseudopilin PulG
MPSGRPHDGVSLASYGLPDFFASAIYLGNFTMSASAQFAKQRKGLAIVSMVLGIANIFTLGLLIVSTVTSIILGAIDLNKIKQNPQIYGGRNQAMAGIIASAVSLTLTVILGILAAITLPALQEGIRRGRETTAIQTLRTIHTNQKQFSAMKGKFGTLQELNQAGLIDQLYSDGRAVSGYVYFTSDISTDDGTAYMDFVLCEDDIIRAMGSKTKGTVKRGEGTPLGMTSAETTAKP